MRTLQTATSRLNHFKLKAIKMPKQQVLIQIKIPCPQILEPAGKQALKCTSYKLVYFAGLTL